MYYFAFIYCLFIGTAFNVVHWMNMTAWFMFYFLLNVARFAWSPSSTPFIDWSKSFWNWLEFARLVVMLNIIIHLMVAEEHTEEG